MIRVNMHEAKSQLSKLVDAALKGEEVVICRADEPVVELRSLPPVLKKPRVPGRLKGIIGPSPAEAFAPATPEEAAEWFGTPVEPKSNE